MTRRYSLVSFCRKTRRIINALLVDLLASTRTGGSVPDAKKRTEMPGDGRPTGRLERIGEVREREVSSKYIAASNSPVHESVGLRKAIKPGKYLVWWEGARGRAGGRGRRVGGALNSPWARDPLNEITGRALPAN